MASGSVLYKITGRTLEDVALPTSPLPPSPLSNQPNQIPVPNILIPVPRQTLPSVSGDWEWIKTGGTELGQPQYIRVPRIPSGFEGISIPAPP